MPENKELEKHEKKIAGLFFDLNKMEKVLDDIMKNLEPVEGNKESGSYKLDFSMTVSPEGEVTVQGNDRQKQAVSGSREPLVEISEQAENILITAEMPGVEEKSLEIKAEEKAVEITASGEKKFFKRIDFQTPIKKVFSKKFKNGILELHLNKK